MPDRADLTQVITLDQAASLAGRSGKWVQNLARAGHMERQKRGRYDLQGFVRGVVAHYETLLEDSTKADAANKATAARTREIELRISERLRELIPLDEAILAFDMLIAAVRREMDSIPAAFTRDIADRKRLEALVDDAKIRICDALAKTERSARTGRVAASGEGGDA